METGVIWEDQSLTSTEEGTSTATTKLFLFSSFPLSCWPADDFPASRAFFFVDLAPLVTPSRHGDGAASQNLASVFG